MQPYIRARSSKTISEYFNMQQKNIIHLYFKKEGEGSLTLVQINPETFQGLELTVQAGGAKKRKLDFDENIYESLKVNGFKDSGALEFNLFLKGLVV